MAAAKRKSSKSRTRTVRAQIRIPRTHSAAKKLGYAAAKIKFSALSDDLKAGFVEFEGGGNGTVCGIGPSPDPAYWLVCYKNASGICDWRHVPKGGPLEEHE